MTARDREKDSAINPLYAFAESFSEHDAQ